MAYAEPICACCGSTRRIEDHRLKGFPGNLTAAKGRFNR
jgi:hypothetical protein